MKECPACLFCQEDAANVCPVDGTTLRPELPGSTVLDGKYKLERRLGVGGMGIVYRARHLGLERTCALKLIRFKKEADSRFLARFRIEAKALGRLKHPNIVGVMDFGVDPRSGGLAYLVMEYLEGQTLEDYRAEAGSLALDEALPIFDSIARAIDHAHEQGILHRDLKPANFFLSSDEPVGRSVKILDFGLARLIANLGPLSALEQRPGGSHTTGQEFQEQIGSVTIEEAETLTLPAVNESAQTTPEIVDLRLTEPGSIFGTLPYMAPELLRGTEAVAASDNYAFGALIFEVLVGRTPFGGSAADVMTGHLQDRPSIPHETWESLPDPLCQHE